MKVEIKTVTSDNKASVSVCGTETHYSHKSLTELMRTIGVARDWLRKQEVKAK